MSPYWFSSRMLRQIAHLFCRLWFRDCDGSGYEIARAARAWAWGRGWLYFHTVWPDLVILITFGNISQFFWLFGNLKFLVIYLVISLKVSNILVIAWNSTKYARMTQPVIQKFKENSCRSMPAKLYIQLNCSCWPKLSSWIDEILLITTHPVLIAG
jgi:hypothetical protein